MATVEYIEEDGRRTFAIVPMTLWRKAIAALGEVDDALPAVPAPDEAILFPVPDEVSARIQACGSSIQAWREHRQLSQTELARAASISKAYLSQIESGVRQGSVKSLKAIATALHVPLDALTR